MWCQKIQRMVVSSSFWCSPCSQTTGPSRLSMWWVLTRACNGYLVISRGILFFVATYVYDYYMYMERESVRNCLGKSWESLFSRFDPLCFFGYPVLSASVRFPCYLQHFEAGNSHFNGICNILEFEQLIFHDICNILVLQVFMLLVFLQLEFI